MQKKFKIIHKLPAWIWGAAENTLLTVLGINKKK